MARAFRRRRGRFVADLAAPEREIVLDCIVQTAALLEREGGPAPGAGPLDPAGGPAGEDADEFEAIMRRAGLTDAAFSGDGPGAAADGVGRGAPPVSDDPAVRRLLPDGHRDDPAQAEAFRALSAQNVRSTKLTHLHRAAEVLAGATQDRLDLGEDDARALLLSLTDVRLVLAERLELRTDDDVEHLEAQLDALDAGDGRAQVMLTYDFLTWFQETLASAMLPR
ncbi:DUF2017 family protein [Agilicoccus flavus]|uniref:DUF2017 family protein n=1 Tax=Agilicoccus flavus TaxID=2775968 RepID=UPI001CF7026A|nr:DUF2017 family protein [Agilicoccus flavus]